jgi:hypothetical protein
MLVDSGPLAALFGRSGTPLKQWAREVFRSHAPPFYTWEPVITEVAHLTSPDLALKMVDDGDLVIDFDLAGETPALRRLLNEYAGRMDLADACLVRMSELFRDCRLLTIDRADFTVYRRFGHQVIPCLFPPD